MNNEFYSLEGLKVEAGIDFSEEQIRFHLMHERLTSCVRLPYGIAKDGFYFLPKFIAYAPEYIVNNSARTIGIEKLPDLADDSFKCIRNNLENNHYVFPLQSFLFDDVDIVTRCFESLDLSIYDEFGMEQIVDSGFNEIDPPKHAKPIIKAETTHTKIRLIRVHQLTHDKARSHAYEYLDFRYTFQEIKGWLFKNNTVDLQILFPRESAKNFIKSLPELSKMTIREQALNSQLLVYKRWLREKKIESYESARLKNMELWRELSVLNEALFKNHTDIKMKELIRTIKNFHRVN